MGGKIRLLDEQTANQIAAGEVVERPASVVKELVENAVDAGARRITVELKAGGSELVRVIDDGCGIAAEDLPLAVQRHATSKIQSAGDLERIQSLGFRGEALPSIAAVSRLEILTREPEALAGCRQTVRGSRVEEFSEAGCPAGTQITVTELFFNAPARRKTLRGTAAELDRCLRTVTGVAVAHPEVAFRFIHNGRQVLGTPGTGRLLDAVHGLYGREVGEGLLPVEGEENGLRLEGYIGAPAAARAGRSHQFFIVNGRPVSGFPFAYALEEAFRGFLPGGRHPMGFLRLDLAPDRLDVNVHPTKMQVRFQDDGAVIRLVRRAVAAALSAHDLTPRVTTPQAETAGGDSRWMTVPLVREEAAAYDAAAVTGPTVSWERQGSRPGEEGAAGAAPPVRLFPALRPLGQVGDTYIIAAGDEGLYIIDQHAAHERLNYENFLVQHAAGGPTGQPLAVPEAVTVGQAGVAAWEHKRAAAESLGFRAEPFGLDTLLLREVPALLAGAGAVRAFQDLLDRPTGGDVDQRPEEELVLLASRSCKSAVKAHDPLSITEMAALLADLARAQNPFTCPHGRPALLSIGWGDLERMFKRT